MLERFGKEAKDFCKPSGDPITASLAVVWHYATLTTTDIPEWGWTDDTSNCCMKSFARRFGLEASVAGLTNGIYMMEHCFQGYDYRKGPPPYKSLPEEEMNEHLQLKARLFNLFQGPVFLLLGSANNEWSITNSRVQNVSHCLLCRYLAKMPILE